MKDIQKLKIRCTNIINVRRKSQFHRAKLTQRNGFPLNHTEDRVSTQYGETETSVPDNVALIVIDRALPGL